MVVEALSIDVSIVWNSKPSDPHVILVLVVVPSVSQSVSSLMVDVPVVWICLMTTFCMLGDYRVLKKKRKLGEHGPNSV